MPQVLNAIKSNLHYTCPLQVVKLASYILIPVHFSNVKQTEDIAIDMVFKVRDNLFHKMF